MANLEREWVGFDLDGTLAVYDGWQGPNHIGKPIPEMVRLLKLYLAAGFIVKIFTARAVEKSTIPHVQEWCEKHIGVKLPVTNVKDFDMLLLYDDRCMSVQKNTGNILGYFDVHALLGDKL